MPKVNEAKNSAVPSGQPLKDTLLDAAPSDDDEREFLTPEQAEAMLGGGDRVHTFRNPVAGVMVGADWDRADVVKAFHEFRPELAGAAATAMGHGIVLIDRRGPLFIEAERQVTSDESGTQT